MYRSMIPVEPNKFAVTDEKGDVILFEANGNIVDILKGKNYCESLEDYQKFKKKMLWWDRGSIAGEIVAEIIFLLGSGVGAYCLFHNLVELLPSLLISIVGSALVGGFLAWSFKEKKEGKQELLRIRETLMEKKKEIASLEEETGFHEIVRLSEYEGKSDALPITVIQPFDHEKSR